MFRLSLGTLDPCAQSECEMNQRAELGGSGTALLIPAESDYYQALLFPHQCLIDSPAGVNVRCHRYRYWFDEGLS